MYCNQTEVVSLVVFATMVLWIGLNQDVSLDSQFQFCFTGIIM